MGYNLPFLAPFILLGQRLDTKKKNVTHVTAEEFVSSILISKIWDEIYINHLEHIFPLGDDYDKMETFQECLAKMKNYTGDHKGIQLFHAVY